MTAQLSGFLEIATEAAIAAGEVLLSYLGNIGTATQKGRPGDLVTVADKASEAVVLEILQRHKVQNKVQTTNGASVREPPPSLVQCPRHALSRPIV